MDKLIFTNATLIDVDKGARPNATVTIAGERIEAVTYGAPIPVGGATTIDLKGRSIMLRWATRHGAEMMGRGHELGSLSPGMLADLIVIDGDPISDITVLQQKDKIVAVLKGGRFEKDLLSKEKHPKVFAN